MSGIPLLISTLFIALIMLILWAALRNIQNEEISTNSPLESGLASAGQIWSGLSLQFLTLLVLFLILDLEIILVISLSLSTTLCLLPSITFLLLVLFSLWAEWAWGNLIWTI